VGNVHITLKFFGQIPEAQVEPIVHAASRIAAAQAPFSLKVTGAGAFPTVNSPRVVWLGVGGDLAVMGGFYRKLEEAFAALGFPPEGRLFAPHLTLGRVKSPRGRLELSRRLAALAAPEGEPFQVGEIILYRLSRSAKLFYIEVIFPLRGRLTHP
jgi:2'-5' RNA ligase